MVTKICDRAKYHYKKCIIFNFLTRFDSFQYFKTSKGFDLRHEPEVPSLSRDKGTTGQAKKLTKGRDGSGQPKSGTGQSRKGCSKTEKECSKSEKDVLKQEKMF